MIVDAVSSTESIVPGETFRLDVERVERQLAAPANRKAGRDLPAGWQVQRTDTSADAVPASTLAVRRFTIRAPDSARISQPYFLTADRVQDYYSWPGNQLVASLPFDPGPLRAAALIDFGGVQLSTSREATRRIVDSRQGESRRPIHVVPQFVLTPEPATALLPLAIVAQSSASVAALVEVKSNGKGGEVVVTPVLPSGWRATPDKASVSIDSTGEPRSVKFAIAPPRNVAAGSYTVRFAATDAAGHKYDLTQRVIDYPHIANRVLFEPACLQVTVLDAKFARGMRVGYVVGMDARVPPVLDQLGLVVDHLNEDALASADLSKYDAIVVGSRAYEVRRDWSHTTAAYWITHAAAAMSWCSISSTN